MEGDVPSGTEPLSRRGFLPPEGGVEAEARYDLCHALARRSRKHCGVYRVPTAAFTGCPSRRRWPSRTARVRLRNISRVLIGT